MPIVIPVDRRLIPSDDEEYSLPINMLTDGTTEGEEELLAALTLYRPATRFREGDLAILLEVPSHLRKRPVVPRIWKVRFVVTRWAWDLMKVATLHGGNLTASQAIMLLESYKHLEQHEYRRPLIFATGYPQGDYENSAAWLPEPLLKRLIRRETTQSWERILYNAHADYRGYDTEQFRTNFVLDLEPNNYKDGRSLQRPFDEELPLVHVLHSAGLGPYLELPYINNEPDRLQPLDPEHDQLASED